ncbi:acyl carrier protein [bacterium]|nr:acyl carrier protein [bacterium]
MKRDELIALLKVAIEESGRPVPDSFNESTLISNLGFDSLDFVNFLFEAEDRLGIILEMESVAPLKTIGELMDLIASKVSSSS